MISFKDIKFGQASAELEGSYFPELLTKGFLDPWSAVEKILNGPICLFLGYKGAGKSSIGEHMRLLAESEHSLFVEHVFLSDFPYGNFNKIISGEAEPESRLPSAWSWILTLRMLSSFACDEGAESINDHSFNRSIRALEEVGLLTSKSLKELVIASSKPKFKAKLPVLLEMEWDTNKTKVNDLEFLNIVDHLKTVMNNFKSSSNHIVIIDGLDDILLQKDVQYQSIAALILEVTRMNLTFQKSGVKAKVVVLCRTELFEKLPGPNKNKFRQDLSIELDWYHNPQTPESSNLVYLVNNRASLSDKSIRSVFVELLPKSVHNKPLLIYLLQHTRHTPRDFIQLLTHIQECSQRRPVEVPNITAGVRSYASKYFLPEIKDELVGYVSREHSNAILRALATIKKRVFSLEDVSKSLQGTDLLSEMDLHEILDTLFKCSAIGNVDKSGDIEHFSFQYRNRHSFFKSDEHLVLHMGLSKAMNIRWKSSEGR